MPTRAAHRAVVLGASVAGLLAAAVLAQFYDEVEILDRDPVTDGPQPRGGVPHGRHPHGLLPRGRSVLEELVPGLTADLLDRGADEGDVLGDGQWYFGGRPMPSHHSGLPVLGQSRALLEDRLRAHVSARPNVRLSPRTEVVGLTAAAGRVTGVLTVDRAAGGTRRPVGADLVVDASGRGSTVPHWLTGLGYPAPPEERVRIDLTYTSRRYRFDRAFLDGRLAVAYAAWPGQHRGGLAVVTEGGVGILSLTGALGDRAPADPDGFAAFAHTLPVPVFHRIVDTAEPIDERAFTYRFAESRRRRFDLAERLPAGLLVTGDAACCFNPVYAQGLTVAGLDALALRDELRLDGEPDPRRFARRVVAAGKVAWDMSTGADRAFHPDAPPPPLKARLVGRYLGRLRSVALGDPTVATALMRVASLVAPPQSLFAPRVAMRVARGRRPAG